MTDGTVITAITQTSVTSPYPEDQANEAEKKAKEFARRNLT